MPPNLIQLVLRTSLLGSAMSVRSILDDENETAKNTAVNRPGVPAPIGEPSY
jgi:hypothetical protein